MPTVGPRVEFRLDHYPRLRAWDSEKGRDRYLYLHRLVAYAQGEMDDLWAGVDVHHDNRDSWDNRPENLTVVEREQHAKQEPHVKNLKRNGHGYDQPERDGIASIDREEAHARQGVRRGRR